MTWILEWVNWELPLWLLVVITGFILFSLQLLHRYYRHKRGRALSTSCFVDTVFDQVSLLPKQREIYLFPPISNTKTNEIMQRIVSRYRFPANSCCTYRFWHIPYKVLFCINQEVSLSHQEVIQAVAHASVVTYGASHRLRTVQSETALRYWQMFGQQKVTVKIPSTNDILELHRKSIDAGILTYVFINSIDETGPLARPIRTSSKSLSNGSQFNSTEKGDSKIVMISLGPAPAREIDKYCRHLKLL